MLLKGSQRGGAKQLSNHLLNGENNEHVEVHEVKGFMSRNLHKALNEAHAISKGTKCKQFLFSVSLNPPEKESVSVAAFEDAIAQIEKKLGLEGQPRVVVFHEKEGRRHAHCVWSRIKTDTMTAVNMSLYKRKLNELSKELYMEHGWDLPEGFLNKKNRDPRNFSHEQWQQAKRMEVDPRTLKDLLRESWAISDNRESFIQALQERGFFLAKGDRKSFVVLDYRGEVMSLPKWSDVKARELKARLGDPATLPSVQNVKDRISQRMNKTLKRMEKEVRAQWAEEKAPLREQLQEMKLTHRKERESLNEMQARREAQEMTARTQKISKGFKGLWQKLTGKYWHIRRQNEEETRRCKIRDRKQQQALRDRQHEERARLQEKVKEHRQRQNQEYALLQRDMAYYMDMKSELKDLGKEFKARQQPEPGPPEVRKDHSQER